MQVCEWAVTTIRVMVSIRCVARTLQNFEQVRCTHPTKLGVCIMATEKQIEANRCNVRLSTGRRTDKGRCRGRMNAAKHGLNAKVVLSVLPQEWL